MSDTPQGTSMELQAEREAIAQEARRYASHYKPGSDGMNTFVMLAEWIEARSTPTAPPANPSRDALLADAARALDDARMWLGEDDRHLCVSETLNELLGRLDAALARLRTQAEGGRG